MVRRAKAQSIEIMARCTKKEKKLARHSEKGGNPTLDSSDRPMRASPKSPFQAILTILALSLACGDKPARPPASSSLVYPDHPAVQARNWDSAMLQRPIEERIRPIDSLASSYVEKWNQIDHFDQVPAPASLAPAQKQAFLGELRRLPAPLQAFMEKHLFAIFLCKDLGGSAMAGVVLDGERAIGGFVILDVDVLSKPANDWITFKEGSVFRPQQGMAYRVEMEPPSSNTSASAMRFVFVHELAHVFGQVNRVTAPWQKEYHTLEDSAFFRLGWKSSGQNPVPLNGMDVSRISFYRAEPPYSVGEAKDLYHALAGSPLPSLYAAVDMEEDWAETFALYVHCVLLKKPYRVILSDGPEQLVLADSRITGEELRQKREFVANLLGR